VGERPGLDGAGRCLRGGGRGLGLLSLKWSADPKTRTRESLLSAIMAFFKDNPGWE